MNSADPHDTDDTLVSFGDRLKSLIKTRKTSQAQLSRDTKIDRAEINRICNDKRDPRPHEVVKIARAFGMDAEDLLRGVKLPEQFAEVRAELERISAELLRNQQEKDEAVAELEAEREQIEEERRAWRAEREDLHRQLASLREAHAAELEALERQTAASTQAQVQQLAQERQRCAGEVANLRRAAAAREQELLAQVRDLGDARQAAEHRFAKARAEGRQLKQAVQQLQAEVTNLRGQRIITGVLGALGGIMLGGGGGDDDDDY